jgi:hypothetical protein
MSEAETMSTTRRAILAGIATAPAMAVPIQPKDQWVANQKQNSPLRVGDRQFACSGRWALASDGVQWILQRLREKGGRSGWRPVSFVHSTKAVLARCMKEKGVPPVDARRLLDGVPDQFHDRSQSASRLV